MAAINRIYETSNGTDDGADVAVIQALRRSKTENRLPNYISANWNDIQHPEFVDNDGAYAGYFIRMFSLSFLPHPLLMMMFFSRYIWLHSLQSGCIPKARPATVLQLLSGQHLDERNHPPIPEMACVTLGWACG